MDEAEAEAWLRRHLDHVVQPLLQLPWILDIFTTVKPVYGRHEGAETGYNPLQRGRPLQVMHVYERGGTRLVLEAEVEAGNRNHALYGLPGLGRLLEGLRPQERPTLVQGDRGYGTERVMADLEQRGQDYLFQLTLKPRVQDLVQKLASQESWTETGQSWEAAAADLQLSGWTRRRKVVVLRRRLGERRPVPRKALKRKQLGFAEIVLGGQERYEYSVLVTSLAFEPLTLAQLYRDHADAENAFDELKRQCGWGGFGTRDRKRTRIMVRMNALFHNWWSLFVRLIELGSRREARTSRPLLMDGVGRVTRHSRQTTLLLTIAPSASAGLRAAFAAMSRFLREIQNAPQWTAVERWRRIPGRALQKDFQGRAPRPPPGLLPA